MEDPNKVELISEYWSDDKLRHVRVYYQYFHGYFLEFVESGKSAERKNFFDKSITYVENIAEDYTQTQEYSAVRGYN